MYTLPRYSYMRRSFAPSQAGKMHATPSGHTNHPVRIRKDLKGLGVSWFGLSSMEAKYLPNVIHQSEHIGGVVYGRHPDGFAMLVATDLRVIFLDCKPLFINEDEINYYVVSGVSIGHVGLTSTVTLHTRIKDYKIRTFNPKCAAHFVEYIESRCLEHEDPLEEHNVKFN